MRLLASTVGLATERLPAHLERLGVTRVWLVCMAAVSAVHATTLTISPPVWMDEVQILEFGRFLLSDGDGWTFMWHPSGEQPPLSGYVGALLHGLSLQAFGAYPEVSRAVSLLASCLAATCLLGWLRARGVSAAWALVFALGFLLDPVFVAGYRGARVDAQVLATVFASCWLLRVASRSGSLSQYGFAGFLAGASVFFWPTAPLATMIVPVEGWLALEDTGRRGRFSAIAAVCAAGIVAVAIGVWGIALLQPEFLEGSALFADQWAPGEQPWQKTISDIVGSVGFDPLFWLAVAWSATQARRLALIPLLVAWCAAVASVPYVHRVVYILPAGFLLIAEGLSRGNRQLQRGLALLAVGAALWGVGISLGGRTVVAARAAEARATGELIVVGEQAIGQGPRRVYVEPWEFYYTGRQLGWRMFHPYLQITDAQQRKLASMAEYSIVTRDRVAEVQSWGLGLELLDRQPPQLKASPEAVAKWARYAIFRNPAPMETRQASGE